MRIEPATSVDLDSMCALLNAAHLPTDGLAQHLKTALVARAADAVIGCVALERYDDLALLRSLVVTDLYRRHGVGQSLAIQALELARQQHVTDVYLLTMTATAFFAERFGFRVTDRAGGPPSVLQSVEFVSACPATAQVMVRKIEP